MVRYVVVTTLLLQAKEKAMDKKTSNSAHRLAVKEQKIIPNLVMKVEQFENSLLKLNKKFNIKVSVKPSTSRDFRYRPEMSNDGREDLHEVNETISVDEERNEDNPTPPSGRHAGESTAQDIGSQLSSSSSFGRRTYSEAGIPASRSPIRSSPSRNSVEPKTNPLVSPENSSSPAPDRAPPTKKAKLKALGMRRR